MPSHRDVRDRQAREAAFSHFTTRIHLVINGANVAVDIEPRVSLLDALRENLGLTGSKKGCNQGACGACTVLVDGQRVLSCLTLAVQAEGREITTVEGLGESGTFTRFSPLLSSMTVSSAATARPASCAPRSA